MIQLSFQPALDPYHTMFRILRMISIIKLAGKLQGDHVRIMDFFLVFPYRISVIRLLATHKKYRKLAERYESARPYGSQPEDQILFDRMNPIQVVSFQNLAAKGFISGSMLEKGWIETTGTQIHNDLLIRINNANRTEADLMEFIKVLALDYNFLGSDGLKGRSKLMDHRYDTI